MSDRVTLATIAERLGVAVSTVSNAYNRPDQLSAAMREKVLATARELGYAGPDPRASALRRGRVGAIGLIERSLPVALTDPASLMMLGGVAEACDEAGVALVIIPSRHPGSDIDVVRSAVVDGFVAHCDALDPDRRVIVEERRLPLVVLDGIATGGEPRIDIDEEGGAATAARHVIDLGHRRIGIVKFSPHGGGLDNSGTRRRLAGYETAIADAGTDADVVVVQGSAYEREATRVVAKQLLSRAERPTAVLAMSDEMAFAVIEAARSLGLRVPADLSVVGFDDIPSAATSSPSLTTVHQPHAAKGAAAVRALLAGVDGEDRTFPTELIVRESTAPPR